jgi:hypothetical protein
MTWYLWIALGIVVEVCLASIVGQALHCPPPPRQAPKR